MRRRRNTKEFGKPPGDHDGILDVLANLIGVLTLVGALSAVVAANAAIRIKTPMSRSTSKDFFMIIAGREGIWNIQPAKDALFEENKQRIREMQSCLSYGLYGMSACFDHAMNRVRTAQVGQARFTIDGNGIYLTKSKKPDIQLKSSDAKLKLESMVNLIAESNRAVFILLEKGGFQSFRDIRNAAGDANIELGWEPWDTDSPVYFSGGGRSMTVQ